MVKDLRDREELYMPGSGTSQALDNSGGIEALQRWGVVPQAVGDCDAGAYSFGSDTLDSDAEAFHFGYGSLVVGEASADGVKAIEFGAFHEAPTEELSGSSLESSFYLETLKGLSLDVAQAEAPERELGHKVYAEYGKLALLYELNEERAYGILAEFDDLETGILTREQRDAIAQVYAAVATHFSQDLELIHIIEYTDFLDEIGVEASSFAIVQNIDLSKVAMEYYVNGEFVEFLDVLIRKAEEIFEIDYVPQDDIPYGFQEDPGPGLQYRIDNIPGTRGLILPYETDGILAHACEDVLLTDGGRAYLDMVMVPDPK